MERKGLYGFPCHDMAVVFFDRFISWFSQTSPWNNVDINCLQGPFCCLKKEISVGKETLARISLSWWGFFWQKIYFFLIFLNWSLRQCGHVHPLSVGAFLLLGEGKLSWKGKACKDFFVMVVSWQKVSIHPVGKKRMARISVSWHGRAPFLTESCFIVFVFPNWSPQKWFFSRIQRRKALRWNWICEFTRVSMTTKLWAIRESLW